MFPIVTVLALGAAVISIPDAQVMAADVADEVRQVGAFDGLAVEGSLTIEVEQGGPARVVVTGPASVRAEIDTFVKDNTLHVAGGGDAVKVRVTMPALREVSVAGSGRVVGSGTWKNASFSAAIAGSGRLTLTIQADLLEIAIAGSGHVELGGEARHAKVAIQGSGHVELGVKERLEAAIAGSGSVRYRGTEAVKVDAATAGSGRVQRVE